MTATFLMSVVSLPIRCVRYAGSWAVGNPLPARMAGGACLCVPRANKFKIIPSKTSKQRGLPVCAATSGLGLGLGLGPQPGVV